MPVTRKAEARILDRTELELVEATHYPEICALGLDELRNRQRLLREYRDKAQDRKRQQRREMRGKGEARGAAPSRDNSGTALKHEVLTHALKRVQREIQRHLKVEQRALTQGEIARRALEMKRASRVQHHPAAGRTAGGGLRGEGHRPGVRIDPRTAGSISQAGRVAQAARDSRG